MTTDQMSIFDSGPSRQRYRAVLAQAADDAHLTLIRMEPTGSTQVLHQKGVVDGLRLAEKLIKETR